MSASTLDPAGQTLPSTGRPGAPGPAPRHPPRARPARRSGLSLRSRLVLLVAVAVGLAIALAAVAAYVTVRSELRRQLDASLVQRAKAAVNSPLGDPALLPRVPSLALSAADVRVALVDASGAGFVPAGRGSAPPLGRPELAVARGASSLSLRTVHDGGTAYRVVAVPDRPQIALVLARSLAETDATLRRLGFVLAAVGLVGIAVAAAAGWAVARAALRPVERLTGAAEHVARTQDLSAPIAVSGNDELARLAESFNAMLGALDTSRERQRQLVADASHELRTPLTSLRTNLDLLAQSVAAGGPGLTVTDRDALLADVRAQLVEMSGLVTDLVELARDDAAQPDAAPVDLAEVVERAVERVRRRAPHVAIRLSLEDWAVVGQSRMLERAVTNLLDNAVKWSPPGATVEVALHHGELTVADQGPGIDTDDLPRVFERFYRAPEARGTPGSGLGLAIVAQTAAAHGGTVTASRRPTGGTLLRLVVPGSPPASPPAPRSPAAPQAAG